MLPLAYTAVKAMVEFSNGFRALDVHPSEFSDLADHDSVWVVRQSPELLRWHAEHAGRGRTPVVRAGASPNSAVQSLCSALDAVAREAVPYLFQERSLYPELGNVILRDSSQGEGGYTATAHRDLDERAVSNLKDKHGAFLFLNFWVPLNPVVRDHLGICCPEQVDIPRDSAGFKNLEGDYTGLNARAGHRWVYVPNLKPGDVIIWRSEIVYHASLTAIGSGGGPAFNYQPPAEPCRKSIDLRIWYNLSGPAPMVM